MKPSELPGARSLYRLTNHALAQIKELWQYGDEEDELPSGRSPQGSLRLPGMRATTQRMIPDIRLTITRNNHI
jgi:hypothetical protein